MSKMAKTTLGLMIALMLSKILGFLRELVLAAYYGTSSIADIYITTLSIPTIIFAGITSALSTTFIPLYFEIESKENEDRARLFSNNIFNIVIIISIILTIFGLIFTENIVNMFAIGFQGETLSIAIQFLRILILGVMFIGLSNISTSYLQIKNKFAISGLVSIPYSLCIIISIIISSTYNNIYIMVWGTLIAIIVKFICQLPTAYKNGYKYELYINFKDLYLKKMICLIGPVFIGVAVNQLNTMIDRTLASTLIEGSISALNYASRLNGFVLGIFITAIATVIYPKLSKLSTTNNKIEFVNTITKSVNTVILLLIPISIGAIVLAEPIVKILFQRGIFNSEATKMTAIALVFYSIGMIGFGLRDILNKVFYSLQDTKIPMTNGAMAMLLNIILNLILVRFMGHAGLAFATSISAIICILLLFSSMKKKIGDFGQDKIIKTTFKSLIAAIIMGIVTYFVYNILANIFNIGFISEVISLFVSIGIGSIAYGVLVIILKVEEVNIITDILKKKLKI